MSDPADPVFMVSQFTGLIDRGKMYAPKEVDRYCCKTLIPNLTADTSDKHQPLVDSMICYYSKFASDVHEHDWEGLAYLMEHLQTLGKMPQQQHKIRLLVNRWCPTAMD